MSELSKHLTQKLWENSTLRHCFFTPQQFTKIVDNILDRELIPFEQQPHVQLSASHDRLVKALEDSYSFIVHPHPNHGLHHIGIVKAEIEDALREAKALTAKEEV